MTTMTNPDRPAATARRRSSAGRRIVITLVVLVGLLVIADFAAAAIFEHEVSKRVRTQFGLADDPSVNVGGFPFLPQAISGEYDKVTVDAKGVPVNDVLRDVEVYAELLGVQAPLSGLISGSITQIPVRQVNGEVRVKASDLNRAISQSENDLVSTLTQLTIDPVSERAVTDPDAPAEPNGTEEPEDTSAGARICTSADLINQSTNLCVFGVISLADDKVHFAPKRLEVRNGLSIATLPPPTRNAVLDRLTFTVAPGGLPFKVTPTVIKIESGMVIVRGTAQNVTLGG